MMLFILTLVHLLLSGLIAFMGKNTLNKQERFCNVILALFLPVGGYILVFMLYLLKNRRIKEIEEEPVIEALDLFSNRGNREKDLNIVSLEETLLINDTKIKRQQIIEAVKKDASSYIDMLKIALRDEDVETSHYAASAILEIKRNLDLKLQTFSIEYEKNKFDIELLEKYADVLEEYLGSGLLDEGNRKKYLSVYAQLLENLIKSHEENPDYYEKLINAFLEMGDEIKAEKYCKAFLNNYRSESAYLMNLKYYYRLKDKKNFTSIFQDLCKSSIKLSNKGVEIVRFWLEGA